MTHVDDERWALRAATPDDATRAARIWEEGWPDGHLGHVPDGLVTARTPAWSTRRAARRGRRLVGAAGHERACERI